jgi:FAD/FMN-containing dehydrogenase
MKQRLSGWGNWPVAETDKREPGSLKEALGLLEGAGSVIPRGLGRAYGDSALNGGLVAAATRMDLMLSFDGVTGELECGPGVTFSDILDVFAPRGWFLPVTPGTKFVTVGGAIAADVHGKNHHVAGSFGGHVISMEVWTSSRGPVRCSRDESPDLFWATVGGHGLTGFITKASFRLVRIPSVHISQTLIKAGSLSGVMDVFEAHADLPYSVAWIDCQASGRKAGRSIFTGGGFAREGELPGRLRKGPWSPRRPLRLSVPFNLPSWALNPLTMKAFNILYYHKSLRRESRSIVSIDKFFYPLDSIHDWNRIYGRRGFLQYQFVLPMEEGRRGLPRILDRIVSIGTGSFLAVLKLFGGQESHPGNISFPRRGYTLALDFPMSRALLPKLDLLDRMVLDHGGRLYLAKDSRTSRESFTESYKDRLPLFLEAKARWDPKGVFSSLQSKRLGMTD